MFEILICVVILGDEHVQKETKTQEDNFLSNCVIVFLNILCLVSFCLYF